MANPKAFVAIGAVYAGHSLVADDLQRDSLLKVLAMGFVTVLVKSAWLGFGAAFSRVC
ncbi:MAG: hypothetical protein Kilf2KO_43670 [Rhodospirillales bacterium]